MENKLPLVSVIIPCRNEETTISGNLESLQKQSYPQEKIEILVADGRSTDHTRQIIQGLAAKMPSLRLIDNDKISSPAGMNKAIQSSHGSVVLILGAHAALSEDYISKAVEVLNQNEVVCVGGKIDSINSADDYIGKAISFAMASPFGIGDAKFRYSNKVELVDTAAFGAYRREIFDRIGFFDESLPRNEDDEFNYRLRKAGGKILLCPEMRGVYYVRPTLRKLWEQYYGYGKGKVRVMLKHPTMMRPRHFIPAIFVAGIIIFGIFGFFIQAAGYILGLYLALYLTVSLLFSISISKNKGWKYLPALPLNFLIIHLAYGSGTWVGLLKMLIR